MRWLPVSVMTLLLAGGVGCNSRPATTAPGPKAEAEWEYSTATKYGQVRQFMTYEEVVKIMGSEGKKAETDNDQKDVLYSWSDVDGRETRVLFRDGKAIARAHDLP